MMRFTLAIVLSAATLSAAEWYEEMEIGPAWANTFAGTLDGAEYLAATKGILVDLGDGTRALFDTETLRVAAVYAGGIHWGGTPWNGDHGKLVRIANEQKPLFHTRPGPGWADESGHFVDPRPSLPVTLYTAFGEKSVPTSFGNLPHARFLGHYRHGTRIVFEYTVNGTRVLEHFENGPDGFVRHLEIAAHAQPLALVAADEAAGLSVASSGSGIALEEAEGRLIASIAPSATPIRYSLSYARGTAAQPVEPLDLDALTRGGDGLWTDTVTTAGLISEDKTSPWVTDTVTLPGANPWKANIRFGGFDFIDADRAALCSWNGDVWIVSGLSGDWSKLEWKRYASGLFEPLGLKVADGVIHVHGRDQITRLHDLNGDGEADRYECFFNGVAVSPSFHEFAFDLQTDDRGDFYFSKAAPVRPGGRGFDTIFPHHGTVMRLSKDASEFEVIATGLRAPGGLGVGPRGEITTGENEGTWQPCCKINFITRDQRPAFFGTEPTRHALADASYTEPLCYLPMDVDNSSGSQIWIPENAKFGLKAGELLHLSYGKSSVFRVLTDQGGTTLQGGVVKLPVTLGSSAMRARFHPDGSLYIAGFRGWQTNAAGEATFQRIRHTGATVPVPDQLEITATGVRLRFETSLDEELAIDPESYSAQRWDYVRGPQYGSGEFSVDHPDAEARKLALERESREHRKRDEVTITAARLLDDGRMVEIDLEGHKPSMSLKVSWDLESAEGDALQGDLHATIHAMGR